MATQLSTTDLVKEMSGKDTLNGWDVLVSYDEDQINTLLNLRAQSDTSLTNVTFTQKQEIPFSDPAEFMDIDWTFQLTNPKLRFLDTNRIRLSYKLTGSAKRQPAGKAIPIQDNVSVQIETGLANVLGTLSDTQNPATADFVPAADATSTASSANYITLMPAKSDGARAVCIDFQDHDLILSIVSTATPPTQIASTLTVAAETLKTKLQAQGGAKYYIAGISSAYSEKAGSELLKPKTFCFTCVAGDKDKNVPGSLCMWISVDGGADNGTRPSGKTSVTFHPSTKDLQPIPKGSTASVVFSHRLMTNYIKAAMLEKNAYDSFSVDMDPNKAGMVITARCKRKISKSFEGHSVMGDNESYDSVNFDMHDQDTTFTFGSKDKYQDISVFYLSDTQNLSWSHTNTFEGNTTVDTKKTSLKFSHGGSAVWVDDRQPGTKTPNMLKLQFTLPSKFDIQDSSSTRGFLIWNIKGAAPPDQYKDIKLDLPKLDFDLRALDYFLTTNLLLPGAHLFHADKPKIDGDSEHGLFMPRDVILTGKVAKEIVAV